VDAATLAAYDLAAGAFADDWHSRPVGADLHALIRRFFNPGPTADIGCGSGRGRTRRDAGADTLLDEQTTSDCSRTVHRIVARKA
jgi:hypothetical protein